MGSVHIPAQQSNCGIKKRISQGLGPENVEQVRSGISQSFWILLSGLHAAEDANEIIAIETCWLQDETSNRILALVKGSIPQVQQKVRNRGY